MFNRYFQQEMEQLKELGAAFAKAHPSVAPMLGGPTADPDVERLLEGVSFQTALLRQKLDDEFPEIVHDMIRLLWPHYLRPVPATTTVAFKPKATMKQTAAIPAGTVLSSAPVEGIACQFRTCFDVEISPLSLLDAVFEQPAGQPAQIRLVLELADIRLSAWTVHSLRFFLAGDYSAASDLYYLFLRHLKQIVLKPQGSGSEAVLPAQGLREAGFSDQAALLAYPSHSFPGYRILQEYFYAPDKFLYLDLTGWERWRNRGDGARFEICFQFNDLPLPSPRVTRHSFALFATPVVNIFQHDADPVSLDHRRAWYWVRPTGHTPDSCQIYSVDKVTGYLRSQAEEKLYQPFDHFNPDVQTTPVYYTSYRRSLLKAGIDVYLAVAYPASNGVTEPAPETLTITLSCTNGFLPRNLRVGDICIPGRACPEYVTFTNIKPLTPAVMPPLGSDVLWRLISHLSLNYLSLAHCDHFQALLDLYVFPDSQNLVSVLANKKRIGGIESLQDRPADRLFRGRLIRGREIAMKLRGDHFASTGDLFIFGCVLDQFLGGYASINSFTALNIEDVLRGEHFAWPPRLGNQPLI